MAVQSFTERADRLIARLAARQHGVVARWQLLEAGVTRHQITLRLAAGRLHEIHRGVYLVGHAVPTIHGRDMAALLACGRNADAVLSHRSAASLWELLSYPATAPAWITVPPERSVTRPRMQIRRLPLEARDIRKRHGLAVTSPPRTILDLAAILDPGDLEGVVAEAHFRGLAREAELRDQLGRNARRPGVRALRAVLDLPGGARRTRSPAERQMVALLRRADLGGYETNARIHGYEVDLLWREAGLVVEIDGYAAHSGRVAFERDRLRTASLNAHGLRVLPVTVRQIRDDPDGVVNRLRAALGLA